jgi:YHS domain-containing protein
MVKLIILAGVGYIFYRALKSWIIAGGERLRDDGARPPAEVDDVLVQDPVCHTYIAQRSSVQLREGGEVLHFCSTQCRDRYLKEHSQVDRD